MNPLSLLFAQYRLYFILAAIAALIVTTGTLVWKYRSAMAESEVAEAVGSTNREAQRRIDKAEAEAKVYRDLSEKKYTRLMAMLGDIKASRAEVASAIAEEIRAHKQFYDQPLTEKGWQQWLKARGTYNNATGQPSPSK